MGDRSNVFIQQDRKDDGRWVGIGLYAHWAGQHMQQVALAAAEASRARRVIHKVLNHFDPEASETDFGLWVEYPCDNEHLILVINAHTGEHWFTGDDGYRHDFVPAAGTFKEEGPR